MCRGALLGAQPCPVVPDELIAQDLSNGFIFRTSHLINSILRHVSGYVFYGKLRPPFCRLKGGTPGGQGHLGDAYIT